MYLHRMPEQGAAVKPVGHRATHGRGQQPAARRGHVLPFRAQVAGGPGHVADRARPAAEGFAQAGRPGLVQDVQLQQDRPPRRERRAVVEHGRLAAEPEVAQVDVLEDVERPDAEHLGGLGHGRVQVVGPVADVVQAPLAAGGPWAGRHPADPHVRISGISSAANSRMLAATARGSMPGWWNWMAISSMGRSL